MPHPHRRTLGSLFLTALLAIPAIPVAFGQPSPTDDTYPALLTGRADWGPSARTGRWTVATTGDAVLVHDHQRRGWRVVSHGKGPGKRDNQSTGWLAAVAHGDVVYLGGGIRKADRTLVPVLWRVRPDKSQVDALPVHRWVTEARSPWTVVRDLHVAGGKLWLEMSRDSYRGGIARCDPEAGKVVPIKMPVGAEIGWTDKTIASGNHLYGLGRVGSGRTGACYRWSLDARTETWTKKDPVEAVRFGRPLLHQADGDILVAATTAGIAFFGSDNTCETSKPDNDVPTWGRPIRLEKGRILLGPMGRQGPLAFDLKTRKWTDLPLARWTRTSATRRTLEEIELAAFEANTRLIRLRVALVIRAARFRPTKDGAPEGKPLPIGTVVWCETAKLPAPEGGGAMGGKVPLGGKGFGGKRRRVRHQSGRALWFGTPNRVRYDGPIAIRRADGSAAFLPGESLWILPNDLVQVRTGTKQLTPAPDSAQSGIPIGPDPVVVSEAALMPVSDGRPARLWLRLHGHRRGPAPGWVAADQTRIAYSKLRLVVGKVEPKVAEAALAMAGDDILTLPAMPDNGGESRAHAATIAALHLASRHHRDGKTDAALKVLEQAEKTAPAKAVGWHGPAAATAALARAELLATLGKTKEALALYRRVLITFGGKFHPTGMSPRPDLRALARYRDLLTKQDGAAKARTALRALAKDLEDPALQAAARR